jgi:tRNA nucleotidyltransferase (CCA-adding enzyme)
MEKFLVGGAVRDELLGIKSKDLDYTVVLDSSEILDKNTVTPETPFQAMVRILKSDGYEIFLESPDFLTVRAMSPSHEAADFVLARKESTYTDGRRPDRVEIGTLEDDLGRRDFRFNAIAKRTDGTFIDPFNGRQDINDRVIRAVGSAFDRLSEDALRAVRALRFSVTKGFRIDREVEFAMETAAVLESIRNQISDERIEQELSKMFRFDTVASLHACQRFPNLTAAMFAGSVSLDSTMKTRGRGRA